MSRKRKIIYSVIATLVILYFIPLPYYVMMPGSAEPLEPFVEVEGGYAESGSLSLVTVLVSRANVYSLASAALRPYDEITKKEDLLVHGESDKEYDKRQQMEMDNAQDAAVINAYHKAGQPVEIVYKGVYVQSVAEGEAADGILKPGDLITEADGQALTAENQFIDLMATKKEGDTVDLTYVRDEKTKDVTIEVGMIEGSDKKEKPGIGIAYSHDRTVETTPEVKIDAEEIGGPSAGLMFSLEIYNQLSEEDITKGHNIAGTGTIDEKGNVGPIGGIDKKVVAADNAGAEVFFAPTGSDDNYKLAKKTAEDIGTDMEIVPVDSFDDALIYLEEMK